MRRLIRTAARHPDMLACAALILAALLGRALVLLGQ